MPVLAERMRQLKVLLGNLSEITLEEERGRA